MTITKTQIGTTVRIEQNDNALRIRVIRMSKDAIAYSIKYNNDYVAYDIMLQGDKVSFYQFIDTCNVVINTFKRLTGYINDTALNDIVSAFADFLR